jgi:hypothetical protein
VTNFSAGYLCRPCAWILQKPSDRLQIITPARRSCPETGKRLGHHSDQTRSLAHRQSAVMTIRQPPKRMRTWSCQIHAAPPQAVVACTSWLRTAGGCTTQIFMMEVTKAMGKEEPMAMQALTKRVRSTSIV